ncbi:MAG TPA: ATP-binding protein, partial [Allosphingosinicella sp.]|nr:ATP-binding protein [Allosphingosinicella sp.]
MQSKPFGPEAEILGELRLPAQLEEVRRLSPLLSDAAGAAGLDPTAMIDLELAMVEAANNIVIHGYDGGSQEEFEVRIFRQGDILAVSLGDRGRRIP